MFSRIQTSNFRSLKSVDQSLGRFQALVGPNASGKTTFLDVIGFLGDLVRGGGKIVETVRSRSASFENLLWRNEGDGFQLAVEAEIPEAQRNDMASETRHFSVARYEIEIAIDRAANEIGLDYEAFWLLNGVPRPTSLERELFPAHQVTIASVFLRPGKGRKRMVTNSPEGNANFYADGRKTYNPSFRLGRQTAALANIPADRESFVAAGWFRDLLASGVQTLTLNSHIIRQPSPPGLGRRFQPDGSNLPWVIAALREDARRFSAWLEHVRTALEDVRDIDTIERPEDKHRYLTVEYTNGAKVPSWLVSDGTLRLLALTIPAYLQELKGTFLIEEPENGIHPRAIETVLQSLSSIYHGQALIATHSPVALNMLEPKEILCFAKDQDGATDIVSGDRHPALRDWKRGEPDLGVLFAAGILS
jgi:predicted ATPase